MPGYPYVLVTTDILKEGEDLHLYCKDVYHYGIAWNPSDMEQRTGRIDRINSACYFGLKDDDEKTFDNSLQVFYPYLADTLEVNQVAKVFNKMNDFVNTFYDITITSERDSKASTDEIVKNIPPQIKSFLISKYDFQNFQGAPENDFDELKPYLAIGFRKEQLNEIMENILRLVTTNFSSFYIEPSLSQNSLKASINLNNRRAPLRIRLVKGKSYDAIDISIESVICKSTALKTRNEKQEIRNRLETSDIELTDNNEFLIAQCSVKIGEPHEVILGIVKKVIQIADDLEMEFTHGDLIYF